MKRILLLYTGGTVGCEGEPLAPMRAERFAERLAELNLLPANCQCELRALSEPLDSANMRPGDWLLYTGGTVGCEGEPLAPMRAERFAERLAELNLLPANCQCELRALSEPLDSANMRPGDWLDIAQVLLAAWNEFDGFVVLHGTDTMAYTAAALSFFFAGIDKPVVLTGAQFPLDALPSDASNNLSDAIATAGRSDLCEVVICFAGRILRGNRSVKCSATALEAFVSPNWPDLGAVRNGTVLLSTENLLPVPARPFDGLSVSMGLDGLRKSFADCPVWAVYLHPGFPVSLLSMALTRIDAPRGWVLASYGAGNAQAEILEVLQQARAQGVAVVAVTQTGHGMVNLHTYLSGEGLARAGVISGQDMTLSVALVKLQVSLARGFAGDQLATVMSTSLAGELTPTS